MRAHGDICIRMKSVNLDAYACICYGVHMSERTPTETEIAAWARLVRVSQRLVKAVEAALKRAGLPPLAWYDALLELRRAGDEGLRPQALQQAMLLEQHRISRLLDRLEAAGLVERRPCPEDRRGQVVHLTPAGGDTLSRMWPVYRGAIATRFAGPLEPGEAETLARILGRLT